MVFHNPGVVKDHDHSHSQDGLRRGSSHGEDVVPGFSDALGAHFADLFSA
jgi:hypothetical protein